MYTFIRIYMKNFLSNNTIISDNIIRTRTVTERERTRSNGPPLYGVPGIDILVYYILLNLYLIK